MSATDDALDVARFCWPHTDSFWWDSKFGRVHGAGGSGPRVWDCRDHSDFAAAERVLVELGLGEAYGRALRLALLIEDAAKDRLGQYLTDGEIAAIRTAPLEVCLRAMARVVREQPKPKETEA